MDKTVKFKIELETNGQKMLHNVSVSTGELREALVDVGKEARRSMDRLSEMAQLGVMFDSLTNVVGRLGNVITGLSRDFNSFDTAMRAANTMAGKNAEDFRVRRRAWVVSRTWVRR